MYTCWPFCLVDYTLSCIEFPVLGINKGQYPDPDSSVVLTSLKWSWRKSDALLYSTCKENSPNAVRLCGKSTPILLPERSEMQGFLSTDIAPSLFSFKKNNCEIWDILGFKDWDKEDSICTGFWLSQISLALWANQIPLNFASNPCWFFC